MTLDEVESINSIDRNNSYESFDEITYFKGVSLLKVIYDMLSEDVFRKGVALYVQKSVYQRSTAKEFFNTLETASSVKLAPIISSLVITIDFDNFSC